MNNDMGRLKEYISFPNAPNRTTEINYVLTKRYRECQTSNSNQEYRTAIAKGCKYIQVNYGGELRVEEVKEFIVHEFEMGDVDDPDLYAAEPLWKWEKSDFGQWVMANAADVPSWHRIADMSIYGYRYQIRAKFFGPALTEYLLRKSK